MHLETSLMNSGAGWLLKLEQRHGYLFVIYSVFLYFISAWHQNTGFHITKLFVTKNGTLVSTALRL